jgi:transposase-like protein
MTKRDPFKYFKTSPEIIRLAMMMYVRFPLSLRNVEDLLHERGLILAMKLSVSGGIDLGGAVRRKFLETGRVVA